MASRQQPVPKSAKKLEELINSLSPKRAVYIFVAIGLSVFFLGLKSPFQGDDAYQIINNQPVHSLANVVQFFEASTFYNGQKLTGVYYRPMMSTVFSLIYTIFGAQPIAYHIVQLGIYIAGAFVLYLIFKRFMRPILAMCLGLIFLVLPINTQVVYSIPTMQDVLFFFFGVMALWVLMTFKSARSMIAAVVLLFMALVSKETALVFVVLAPLYLLLFDKKRLRQFCLMMVLPVVAYVALKINAVGLNQVQHAGPIDGANLAARLYTAPSIIWFYFTKLIFPWKLATGYYWVNVRFSVAHVLLPLLADIVAAVAVVFGAIWLRMTKPKNIYYAYIFFAAWATLAVLPYTQIVPLDMTFSESWFYFASAGVIGLIATVLYAVQFHKQTWWLVGLTLILIVAFGTRSALRALDYRSQYQLALTDISVSSNNYSALSNISQHLIDNGQYSQAAKYAERSIAIYPVVSNWINLGVAREYAGDYNGAARAYNEALKYGNLSIIYENLGLIYVVYAKPQFTAQFLQKAVNEYPRDYKIWLYISVFEGSLGSHDEAKVAIQNAAKYGTIPPQIYNSILHDQPFTLRLLGKDVLIR